MTYLRLSAWGPTCDFSEVMNLRGNTAVDPTRGDGRLIRKALLAFFGLGGISLILMLFGLVERNYIIGFVGLALVAVAAIALFWALSLSRRFFPQSRMWTKEVWGRR